VLVLVVDSATPAVTAALLQVTPEGVTPLGQRSTVDAKAHGELLAPAIDDLLTEAGAKPRDLRAVVAGVGPGPFTGLRVGLVTATAISQTLAIPAYGVCSLDGLGATLQGRALVATDARRREVYWAVYQDGRRLTEPAVDAPAAIAGRLAELAVERGYGEGALRYAEQLGVTAADEPRYPDPAVLGWLAAQRVRDGAPTEPLTPLYLRRPDATPPGPRKGATAAPGAPGAPAAPGAPGAPAAAPAPGAPAAAPGTGPGR
jgi:tRNA threonylcarbamoyl adenosine modification protein YeaZ